MTAWTRWTFLFLLGIVILATTSGIAQQPRPLRTPPIAEGGRYQMLVWGSQENPYLVLLDTQTGQAWSKAFAGESNRTWSDLKTPPSVPKQ
jgi:hypothetical protein